MSLILRSGADVESFERVVLARSNRINRCRLGSVILSLAVKGKNSGEIAEIVKTEGMGGDPPISASTISRWLRATGLFYGRGRSGAEDRNMPAQVRGLLAAYEKEARSAVEETGREFLPKVGKTLRRARKKCLAEFLKEVSGIEELGLLGVSGNRLSGSMTPEFPTVADCIHRVSVPSAPSALGPPNSSQGKISGDGDEVNEN